MNEFLNRYGGMIGIESGSLGVLPTTSTCIALYGLLTIFFMMNRKVVGLQADTNGAYIQIMTAGKSAVIQIDKDGGYCAIMNVGGILCELPFESI